jgi:SAM-dependent methyltransferase
VSYTSLAYRLPKWLRRHLLYFEALIEESVSNFAANLPEKARVLDAGAGEGQYADRFRRQRYLGVDLAVGDARWDYSRLDVLADLTALPFRPGVFDAALHIVTIEHLPEPGRALREIARTLQPGARLLVAAPQDWEVHQAPHDYFRYTRHGLAYLLETAGFEIVRRSPLAGLSSRRSTADPAGAGSAAPRLSGPGPQFHAGVYLHGEEGALTQEQRVVYFG